TLLEEDRAVVQLHLVLGDRDVLGAARGGHDGHRDRSRAERQDLRQPAHRAGIIIGPPCVRVALPSSCSRPWSPRSPSPPAATPPPSALGACCRSRSTSTGSAPRTSGRRAVC